MPKTKEDILNAIANMNGDETEEFLEKHGKELLYQEQEVQAKDKEIQELKSQLQKRAD